MTNIDRALEAFEKGNVKEAEEYLLSDLHQNGPNCRVYVGLGKCSMKGHNYMEAVKWFVEAGRLDPSNAAIVNFTGIAHSKTRELDLAIADFTHAISIESKLDYWYNLGLAFLECNRFEMAINAFDFVIRMNSTHSNSFAHRGLSKIRSGRLIDGIDDCTIAIDLDPKNSLAFNFRSIGKVRQNRFEESIQDCDEAIRLNPSAFDFYYNRGLAKQSLRREQDAIVDYTAAIELCPKYAKAYINRGNVYCSIGRFEIAIADFGKAIELGDIFGYFNRGNVYSDNGQFEQAIKDYTKVIEASPNDLEAYSMRAKAYHRIGAVEQAKADSDIVERFERQLALW